MQDLQKLQLKTIAISKENYEKLSHLGFTNESFNDVISRLITQFIESNKQKEEED